MGRGNSYSLRIVFSLLSSIGLNLASSAEEAPERVIEFTEVTQYLRQSHLGREILGELARHQKGERKIRFARGSISRTDSLLTRAYHQSTGEEVREREVTLILKQQGSLHEIALDLAHELVHALREPMWDPYDPGLTLSQYVDRTILGPGGEAEALLFECQLAQELSASFGDALPKRCSFTVDLYSKQAFSLLGREFYKIGGWMPWITKVWPHSSRDNVAKKFLDQSPTLYSATGGAPYPVSIAREYLELTKSACKNVRRRLSSSRSPASHATKELDFLDRRCSDLGQNKADFE